MSSNQVATRSGGARHRAAIALIAVGALSALSGCGSNIHPGVAAKVNGTAIQQATVDDAASAYCSVIESSKSADSNAVSMTRIRSAFAGIYIQGVLAQDAVDDLGLTITDSTSNLFTPPFSIPDSLSESDKASLQDLLDELDTIQAATYLIGANAQDSSITSSDQITSPSEPMRKAGDKVLSQYATDHTIDLNPIYGTWDGSAAVSDSGSLSVADSTLAKSLAKAGSADGGDTSDLPDVTVCG